MNSTIAKEAEMKSILDAQVHEADRRREVAKEVRLAASQTRPAIVERVVNESLNRLWRDVFVRLAPREPFVPAFGIPEVGRHTLSISLETIHRTGGIAGAPGTMLSAGNLNTAALSLFIALHLAVRPVIPCLVFDDPIQLMDEVHIAQFAALLRLLSKRQVVLAVHERELYRYLALELSPAFEGDELITIELDDDSDSGTFVKTTRVAWRQDEAVAN
jgi:exonuclease SbcC